jgi:hypothetical protein
MLLGERQVVAEATARFACLMRGLASLMESRGSIEFKAYHEDHKARFLSIATYLEEPFPKISEA